MPAYWIAHVDVTDADAYGGTPSRATGAIAAHGGRFLARGGRYTQLEGNDRARNVAGRVPRPRRGRGLLQLARLPGGAGLRQRRLGARPRDRRGRRALSARLLNAPGLGRRRGLRRADRGGGGRGAARRSRHLARPRRHRAAALRRATPCCWRRWSPSGPRRSAPAPPGSSPCTASRDRGVFEVLLVLPLAFPAYVLAYAYTDLLSHPGRGADDAPRGHRLGAARLLVPERPLAARCGADAHLRLLPLRLPAGADGVRAAVGERLPRGAHARPRALGGVLPRSACRWRGPASPPACCSR